MLITIGMPNMPFLYADDFIQVLKFKYASHTYNEMVSNTYFGLDLSLIMLLGNIKNVHYDIHCIFSFVALLDTQ